MATPERYRPPLRLEHRDDEAPRHEAAEDAFDQALEARDRLLLPESAYLHLPWPSIRALTGGMAPSDVWFVAGFSGNGKTTWLLNLVDALLAEGRTVYYLGLETRPHVLRTHLACLRLGYYAGDVLSGAAKAWPDWPAVRRQLIAELEMQRALGDRNRFLVNGVPMVDAAALVAASTDAALSAADVVVIDHVDHLRHADGRSPHEESVRVVQLILDLAHSHNQRFLVATQCNNEAAKGDRLGAYLPPQPHHVYMGSHKRMIATGMLGLYRPLRHGLTREEVAAARSGKLEVRDVLEPNTMGVVLMKHRYYGQREGMRAQLRLEHGRLAEIPERDRYVTAPLAEGPRP